MRTKAVGDERLGKTPISGFNPGEKVVKYSRPSPWSTPFITGYIIGAILIIAFGLGIIIIIITELYRRGHHYYVTNQRCIKETTFLSRKSEEASFDLISNVTFQQALGARLLDFGTIICQMASGNSLSYRGAPDPNSFKAVVITSKQTFLEKPTRTILVGEETKPETSKIKYCSECGAKLEGSPQYCPICGSRLR